MHFGRVLRRTGLPVGPDRVLDALSAVQVAGVGRRDDFYWTLASVFLGRHDQLDLFDQAFRVFWRDPALHARVRRLPEVRGRIPPRKREPELSARVVQALTPRHHASPAAPAAERITFDSSLTFSARESLQAMDFESMTNEELAAARAAVSRLRLRLPQRPTRRHAPDARGARIDPRASLRASLRAGGATLPLRRRSLRRRAPPVVALADVSGSMSRYTRMVLHFLHALANEHDRVQAFTFGTRLTPITRQLRHRDADAALAGVARQVKDWSGGTRIGACLRAFNVNWSRRLRQDAVVLLISDGLDCEGADDLARQIERLRKSCRRLIWLNPLLRYPGFEAKPAGIKAMLPHVDEFLPVHNLQSLMDLKRALEKKWGQSRFSDPARGDPRRKSTLTPFFKMKRDQRKPAWR